MKRTFIRKINVEPKSRIKMKFELFIIFWKILCCLTKEPEVEISSRAISIAIEATCLMKTTTVDICLLSNDTDINIDHIIKYLSTKPVRLETSQNLAKGKELKKCNIFVVNSFNEFEQFQKFLSPEIFDFRGNFLIIIINGQVNEIHNIFKIMWKLQIVNVNALFKNNTKTISMATFLPFHNQKCSDTTPIVINEFIDGKFTKEQFFIEKLENLQQCEVRVVIAQKSEPYIVLENNEKFSGRDIYLMDELAHSLNFKVNYIVLGDKGFLLDNGTSGGIFKLLQNGSADMTICDMWITRNRATYFDATTQYISDDIIFVIPVRAELSSVEKLIYPLDRETWILLIICFAIGFFVILIVSFQSDAVQDFVFGENERHPFLNMVNTFLGGNQTRMPTRNFARFILLIFLAFSMIIRTAYQGAMYQFMNSDKKHKEPQSVEELIELNYNFHVLAVSMELFEHFTGLQKRFEKLY